MKSNHENQLKEAKTRISELEKELAEVKKVAASIKAEKYNIQDIAISIKDHISFEGRNMYYLLDDEIEIEDYTVSFEGSASGYINHIEEDVLNGIEIDSCVILYKDGEYYELTEKELIQLETLITW